VGDLTAAFRFSDATKRAEPLPDTGGGYNLAQYEVSQLPMPTPPYGHQSVPHQEKGNRPHVG
jgi:phospholipase C